MATGLSVHGVKLIRVIKPNFAEDDTWQTIHLVLYDGTWVEVTAFGRGEAPPPIEEVEEV